MEYVETKLVTKNAIITMYRPILTEEERAKRMKKIHDAACDLWIAEEKRKARLAAEGGCTIG